MNVWNKAYSFNLINAEGNGKIAARYQNAYSNDSHDIVLVFCDTDDNPYETYELIKKKKDKIHGFKKSSSTVVIFANPCTMQIILMHFSNVNLSSYKKNSNKELIEKLTKIGSYDAKEKQGKRLFALITNENYANMITNI